MNPFNPANNVNYSAESTGLPTVVATPPHQAENPFFWTVPEEHNLTAVLRYQQRFVDRILSHTLRYDHVLYCMDNETMVTPKWGEYWARYVRRRRRRRRAGRCYITEMRDPEGHARSRSTWPRLRPARSLRLLRDRAEQRERRPRALRRHPVRAQPTSPTGPARSAT